MPVGENLPMTVLIYTNNILYFRYFNSLFFRFSDVLSLLLNRGMVLYGYSEGTQTMDIDTHPRMRGNGEQS